MAFAQRRQLHQTAAAWYETTYAQELEAFYPLLAHHWSQADAPEKAIGYLEKAGEQALVNSAYAEAARFFSEALRLDKGSKREGEQAAQRIEASEIVGQRRRADWHPAETSAAG